jgi:hypothetical protein
MKRSGAPGQESAAGAGRILAGLCYAVAAGVLTQAVLAGLFLSGTGGARVVHIYVGWVLTYFALAVPVVALVQRRRGRASRGVVAGGAVLPVALWVQEVLGAVPNPVTTIIHVPLGVTLFAYAVLLGLASTRPHPPRPRPGPTGNA